MTKIPAVQTIDIDRCKWAFRFDSDKTCKGIKCSHCDGCAKKQADKSLEIGSSHSLPQNMWGIPHTDLCIAGICNE